MSRAHSVQPERTPEATSEFLRQQSMDHLEAIGLHAVAPLVMTPSEMEWIARHRQWITITMNWNLCASRGWTVEHFLWLCGLRGGRAERPPFQASPSFGRWKV